MIWRNQDSKVLFICKLPLEIWWFGFFLQIYICKTLDTWCVSNEFKSRTFLFQEKRIKHLNVHWCHLSLMCDHRDNLVSQSFMSSYHCLLIGSRWTPPSPDGKNQVCRLNSKQTITIWTWGALGTLFTLMGFGVSHCLLRTLCVCYFFLQNLLCHFNQKTKDLFSIHEQIIETLPYFQMHIFINGLGCRRNSD